LIRPGLLICLACGAFAQTTFQEQAARLQNINAYLLDLRPASGPARPDARGLELILDVNPQPSIDPTVGLKEEELDPPEFVPKLRGRYHFGSRWFLGGAYAPGIEFQDYDAEYISLELGWLRALGPLRMRLRASYTDGDVEGPITESDAADLFEFTNAGVDLSAGHEWRSGWLVYGFVGWNDIETSLEIEVDGALLRNRDDTYYGGLGLTWRTGRFGLNLEQNVTDDYLKHIIASVSYWF